MWTSDKQTTPENQFKAILPLNPITENIFYVDKENKNLRIVVSAPIRMPIVWQVSKVEGITMGLFGLIRLTFAQDIWNKETDFIDEEAKANGDLFAMYADYYSSAVTPLQEETTSFNTHMELSCYNSRIKNGGSYKTITASILDAQNTDITSNKISLFNNVVWKCYIDGVEITSSPLVTWLPQTKLNEIKIKFGNDRSYLTKVLVIECLVLDGAKEMKSTIPLEISAL